MQAQGLCDFLQPMLNFITSKRATAAEALQHPWLRGELPVVEAPPPPPVAADAAAKDDARRDRDGGGDHVGRNMGRSRSHSAKRSLSPCR